MPDKEKQRAFALQVVEMLRARGFEAYWAGGCVRDQLLGLVPKDYDVATDATPGLIRELFGERRTLAIGAAFGVVTVLGPRAAGQIEVATFRSDAAYSDGRHPDHVTFTDARHDAERRDFTINGLFYDPVAEEVIDYVDGRADLEARLIRAIGDPRHRFDEDKLRMLRAIRFAATFGFEIERATFDAIREMAHQVGSVSAERIGMEIRRMLADSNRARALALLTDSGLLAQVLPEMVQAEEHFSNTSEALEKLIEPSVAAAMAILCHPFGDGIERASSAGRRLRFTNKEVERTSWILRQRDTIQHAADAPWPRLQRILVHDGIEELLATVEALVGSDHEAIQFCRERLRWPRRKLDPEPLVDGSDLIAQGLKPGPQFSALLVQTRDAQLEGRIATKDEALALVDELLRTK
jgi:tRNA nucleotidyltransferase/poly(A) polymerase